MAGGETEAGAEAESQTRAVDRLTFFSDAVVAIAITLLAVDLPVPSGRTAAALLASAYRNDSRYLAFAISFLAIAAAWNHHHAVFRYARQMDGRLRLYNLAWLLMIILNPFATRFLTSGGNETLSAHAIRWGFYALLQGLDSAAMLAMVRHLVARGQAPGIPARDVSSTNWQSAGLLLGFGLSIPVFFATTYGWLLWIAGPLLAARAEQWRRRAPDRPGADPPPEAGDHSS